MRVLLIEDHHRLSQSIVDGLHSSGFSVDAFATAQEGFCAAKTMNYDAIVLDLGLPDRDGLDVVRELRADDNSTPVLVLTARDGVDDRVVGLDCGADDYVPKPFAMKELAARLRALMRRPGGALGATLELGNVSFDTALRQVKIEGRIAPLSRRETDVLELLMRRAEQVVPKRVIEDIVYGLSGEVLPNTVEALISRLRKRLEGMDAGVTIHTLRGIGYLMSE